MRNPNQLVTLCLLVSSSACVNYPESVTDEEVLAELAECRSDLDELIARVDTIEATLPGLATVAGLEAYATQDQLASYATSASLQDYATLDDLADYATLDDLADYATLDEYQSLRDDFDVLSTESVRMITSSSTINVSSEAEYNAAMIYLDGYRIASNAVVTIQFPASTSITFSAPMQVRHPDGARIRIVGGSNASNRTTLQFTSSSGLVLEEGQVLGYFDGFTLDGTNTASTIGISLSGQSYLECGTNVVVQQFGDGFAANYGSVLRADSSRATDNTGTGYNAGIGAIIRAQNSQALRNGRGYSADYLSGILASSSTSESSNLDYGYLADRLSFLIIDSAESRSNTDSGVAMFGGSYAYAVGMTTSGNGAYGIEVGYSGVVNATGASVAENNGQSGDGYNLSAPSSSFVGSYAYR